MRFSPPTRREPCRLWCEAGLLEELQLVEIQPPFRDLAALDRVDRTPSDPDGLVRCGNGLAARTREGSRMSPREGRLEADQTAMPARLIRSKAQVRESANRS